MTFAHPAMLVVAAAIVAACAALDRIAATRARSQAVAASSLALVARALADRSWIDRTLFGVWVAGVAIAATALAGPRVTIPLPVPDAVVVLCLDTSGSMAATDVQPTRAAAVRDAAMAFVRAVPSGTRVGIVTFSSTAAVLAPPTADVGALEAALERVPEPRGATAIGDALGLAAAQLGPASRRAIVLVTDGVTNRGLDPLQAAERLGEDGIAIDTIGIGTAGSGAAIPGTLDPADLDEDALRTIASDAHGKYVRAENAGALESEFRTSARDLVWRPQEIDASLAFAGIGAALVVVSTLARSLAGKYP